MESLADNSPNLLHGRLRRKEASFIIADARFTRLVEMVEVGPATKYTNAVFQFFYSAPILLLRRPLTRDLSF